MSPYDVLSSEATLATARVVGLLDRPEWGATGADCLAVAAPVAPVAPEGIVVEPWADWGRMCRTKFHVTIPAPPAPSPPLSVVGAALLVGEGLVFMTTFNVGYELRPNGPGLYVPFDVFTVDGRVDDA